ncbi:MAG TPA: hypothetical protein VEW47_14780 [Candidatus Dormibacteraeota bacterium]|nr:hypothetical protein [Candidatus Dormibacteraeota bacterium]
MTAPRTKTLVVSLATGILALLAIGAYFYFAPRSAPGRPSLVHLDAGNINALRDDFNAAAGGTRVVLLLSPT